MNIEEYKRILLAKEKELVERIELAVEAAHEQTEQGAIETGDKSVTDLEKGVEFTEADLGTHCMHRPASGFVAAARGGFAGADYHE